MSKITKLPEVNLSLLKRLIDEMEQHLKSSTEIKNAENADVKDFIVEMSKAAGLATGVMQEAALLVADIQTIVRQSQQIPVNTENKESLLESILGYPKKIPGSSTSN